MPEEDQKSPLHQYSQGEEENGMESSQEGTSPGEVSRKDLEDGNSLDDTTPIPIHREKKVQPFGTWVTSGIFPEKRQSANENAGEEDTVKLTNSSIQSRTYRKEEKKYQSADQREKSPTNSRQSKVKLQTKDAIRKSNPKRRSSKFPSLSQGLGCALRIALISMFFITLLGLCGFSIVFYQYYRIASTLPDINDLRQKASQFETTRIYDRQGNLLYEILDPNAGRRTFVPLEKISPYLVAATIATEDQGFYEHPGFDPFAIIRAFWQNYQSGETVSGASTITQQLARALLFTPEERIEQTYTRKIREAVLAAEITRRYSKDEILELYLNEIYYGNLAYGIEAAAETYFNTPAENLDLGQAAFLAGLPQAPSVYDVYTNPEATFARMEDVLVLMFRASEERNCIYVSNSTERICVDPVSATEAANRIKNYKFAPPDIPIRFPHWVTYVRSLLEQQYDSQTIYRSGFSVFTTLDAELQVLAQQAVQDQVIKLQKNNASNGALVAIKPSSGEILAMVGSADFYNAQISGQVNMAISPRQPGSAIKPLTYLAAFEKGWTAATLLWDVPSEFPPSGRADDPSPAYIPKNYDNRFHGPVTVRAALANSYNIPAVKALQFVGIYDDPLVEGEEGLIALARRLGISTLNREDYGLSLTLGGGEVTLLELTGAYSVFANNGMRVQPYAISRILDHQGNEVFYQQPSIGEQVVRPEHAFLINSILSDNKARTPAFGPNSALQLPFQAAAKTGTTNDFRDNWTIGYTPDLVIGVWVGNADYTPMKDTSGLTGAAPIWNQVMIQSVEALFGGQTSNFTKPAGIVEKVICAVSGTTPSQWCPKQAMEFFAIDQPPLPKEEDLWQKVEIDTWTKLKASEFCSEFTEEVFTLNVNDSWARKWIRKNPQGVQWARQMGFEPPVTFSPSRECTSSDPRPIIEFLSPQNGDTVVSSPLKIIGVVDATEWFGGAILEYGEGEKPSRWHILKQGNVRLSQPGIIFEWDISQLPPGIITLKITIQSTKNTYAEREIRINVQIPTPTPTFTPTSTLTPTATSTPEPTSTPTATLTPTTTIELFPTFPPLPTLPPP